MESPIKAEVFLVKNEDHAEAIETLESAGTAYCTFPHFAGDFVAIAVAAGNGKKKPAAPPPVPGFPGGE